MDNIRAIIWDYDCTLVNTWQKNLAVTRRIITKVSGQDASQIYALSSVDRYQYASLKSINWRAFYMQECRLSAEQTDQAGWLWTEFQLSDDTPIEVFEGIPDVLATLSDYPHGIVSQNSKQSITATLRAQHLLPYFPCIVGYEEVAFDKQKPAPDSLLLCMEHLCKAQSQATGVVCYIGDHEVDAACAFAANQALQQQGSGLHVVSIAAFYGCQGDDSSWLIKPDHTVTTPREIPDIILGF
ncbi:HAD-superfamily hydrolase, subfamily IA, variant 1 [Candidatus Vecturithrix granuli]|uniref:HAD-superfamily hydrolase, subfamily IA, variant 1 n=1 Tax=Vecturithrix granuli TaxID=1499967 RepID=A0A081BVR2_VECG1|nr:HAD-superfamily hydrolase, subfamily IA, variant 1 [Candidatus Vecturithrix granuli]